MNENIIHIEQYKKIRGIIRGELAHFTCFDCKRNAPENYPCECGMMYANMKFKPTDRYVSKIADKIMEVVMEDEEGW